LAENYAVVGSGELEIIFTAKEESTTTLRAISAGSIRFAEPKSENQACRSRSDAYFAIFF
jgi:hypothetical protein